MHIIVLTSTTLSLLLIVFYTIRVCLEIRDISDSISATFFKIKHPAWFSLTMWGTAGFLIPGILTASAPDTYYWILSASLGTFLVGLAPNFTKEPQESVHIVGATTSLIASQVWVGLNNLPVVLSVWPVYIVAIVIAVAARKTGSFKMRVLQVHPLFWGEVSSLVATYITILPRV